MNKESEAFLINCDMGESFGNYRIGNDQEMMPYITAANIACGMHGGDPYQIEKTINLALEHQVNIGAHPGYPDLQGFGRRVIPMKNDELSSYVKYQVAAVKGLVEANGGQMLYVKPHGALYNHMAQNKEPAQVVIEAIKSIDPELCIMGLAGSHMNSLCKQNNMQFISEAFADRTYEDNGQLRSRNLAGALITQASQAQRQVLEILNHNRVKAYSGKQIALAAQSFCIHGDNESAVEIARSIYQAIKGSK